MKINTKNKLTMSAVLGGIGLGTAALYNKLIIRQYTIANKKVSDAMNGLTIVMLSDLHGYTYKPNQKPLIEKIQKQNPDIIMLCGDIFDDRLPQSGAKLLLKEIVKIAPCYYVCGNHEIWYKEHEKLFHQIENEGVTVLHDKIDILNKNNTSYRICGIMDPAALGTRMQGDYGNSKAFKETLSMFNSLTHNENTINILLSHRPEYIRDYAVYPFDIVLCRHAHGGQWRIPYILNGLYAPNQGMFPQYAGGIYKIRNTTQIVGRGLIRDWKPRIFNPPEIVSIKIKK